MLVTEDLQELHKARLADEQSWVLVPTMGALHEGHRSLVREARRLAGEKGSVIVSIFVNPLQFDRQEDLLNYPRDLEQDLAVCSEEGANLVFTPTSGDFYAGDHSVTVSESLLSKHLCGETRPGHFDGVCTVVLKLFLATGANGAVFGKKDYQQLAIIRRLVRDLSVPIEIHGVETVREKDGLALSSRNVRLTESQRADAPRLRRALLAAQSLATCGEQRVEQYLQNARHHLERDAPSDFSLDYLTLVDQSTLQPLSKLNRPALLACACFYGSVRLIDNVEIHP